MPSAMQTHAIVFHSRLELYFVRNHPNRLENRLSNLRRGFITEYATVSGDSIKGLVVLDAISKQHELAKPFSNATDSISQNAFSAWSIFRRQGSCPSLTLLCPSGGCCSYDSTCCGNKCCASGYLCTGGTAAAPCCVAIGSSSNICGSVNSNPCSVSGYLPCTNVNLCCPPSSECYYDSNNVGRCAPLSYSTPKPTTTPVPTPHYTTYPTTTPIPTPHYTTYPTTSPIPTPDYITSSTTTPIPTLYYTPYPPNPTPDGLYTYQTNFWTPAAIGGVAGGSAAFLIVVALLVCCCLGRKNGKYVYRFGPLSDGQIYVRVMDLETTQGWQEFYISEAKRIKCQDVEDRYAWLEDFATRAISHWIIQLQNGGGYTLTTIFSAGISAFPLVKYWAVPWSTKRFNDIAIDALGFGDTMEVNRLAKEAALKANPVTSMGEKITSWSKTAGNKIVKYEWMHSAIREHLQEGITQYLTRELGHEAAMHLMDEIVHIKVGLGTVYSMTRGAYKSTIQKDNALKYLSGEALDLHSQVFIVNALAEIFPEDFRQANEKGDIQYYKST